MKNFTDFGMHLAYALITALWFLILLPLRKTFQILEQVISKSLVEVDRFCLEISPYEHGIGPEALWEKCLGFVRKKVKWLRPKGYGTCLYDVELTSRYFTDDEMAEFQSGVQGIKSSNGLQTGSMTSDPSGHSNSEHLMHDAECLGEAHNEHTDVNVDKVESTQPTDAPKTIGELIKSQMENSEQSEEVSLSPSESSEGSSTDCRTDERSKAV